MSRIPESFSDTIEIYTLGCATHASAKINGEYVSDYVRTSEIRAWSGQGRRGLVARLTAQIFFAERLLTQLATRVYAETRDDSTDADDSTARVVAYDAVMDALTQNGAKPVADVYEDVCELAIFLAVRATNNRS